MSYQPPIDHPVFFNGNTVNTQNWDRPGTTGVLITGIDGWVDGADIRDTRDVATGRDGEVPFNLFLGGRTITISGMVSGSSYANLQANKLALTNVFEPVPSEQVLKLPKVATSSPSWTFASSMSGFERSSCRVTESVQFGEQHGANAQEWVVVLRASDPRVYDDVEVSATDTSTASTQTVAMNNSTGTYPSPCTVQFTNTTSTLSGVTITDSASNESLVVKPTTTIGTGDAVYFDTSQRYLTYSPSDAVAYRLNNFAPVAYWKLDETGAATTAANAANPGTYSGTYVGTPTLGTTGIFGTRMDFDGVNDEVTIAYAAGLVLDTFTIECFSYLSTAASSGEKPLLEWSNGGSTGWYVTTEFVKDGSGRGFDYYYVRLYVNGALTATYTQSRTISSYIYLTKTGNAWNLCGVNASKAVTKITTGTIRFGRRGSSYFKGWLDNVVLYPSVLDSGTLSGFANPSAALPSYPAAKSLDFSNNTWLQIQPGDQDIRAYKSASTSSTLTVKYRPARL